MKKTILSILILCLLMSVSPKKIGAGTNMPLEYAKLDIESTTKGLLFPRVTSHKEKPSVGIFLVYHRIDNTLE